MLHIDDEVDEVQVVDMNIDVVDEAEVDEYHELMVDLEHHDSEKTELDEVTLDEVEVDDIVELEIDGVVDQLNDIDDYD